MMKKLVFFMCICISFGMAMLYLLPVLKDRIYSSETMDYQVIPDDAIRLRILAHSDEEADQEVKRAVRDAVNKTISEWVQDLTEIEAARNLIERNLSTVDEIVGQTLHQHGMADDYQVTYGENIAFPAKLYGSYLYPPGEYEAILITIGEGQGENWWCVLFPPLCFLDFENGTTVAEASEDESLDTQREKDGERDDREENEEEDESHAFRIKFFLFDLFGWS